MLGFIEFMGMGLLWWYLFSVAFSFCFTMMGNTFLKNSGAMPGGFNCCIPTIITSIVPFFNIVVAIQTLRLGIITRRNPETRDLYRKTFLKMEKMAKDGNLFLKMSRDKNEDKDGEDDTEE